MPYAALGACLGHNHLTPGGPHRNPLLLPPAEGQNQEHRPPSRSSRAAEKSSIAPADQPGERPDASALRRLQLKQARRVGVHQLARRWAGRQEAIGGVSGADHGNTLNECGIR